jgi:hypothetical protein
VDIEVELVELVEALGERSALVDTTGSNDWRARLESGNKDDNLGFSRNSLMDGNVHSCMVFCCTRLSESSALSKSCQDFSRPQRLCEAKVECFGS